MSFDKITVVINTFHSEDKICECIDSIPSQLTVVVIENSNNNSFKNDLENNYSNVRCYLAGENLGYAKGNNLGLSKVKTKFALILNPDAKLKKDAIKQFLNSAEKVKDFSIIGPAIQDEFNETNNFTDKDLYQVDYLKGFAMFLNLEEFRDIGYFDENFFIYLEETDLCKRIKLQNKKIYLDRRIKITRRKFHNKDIDYEMELSKIGIGCG